MSRVQETQKSKKGIVYLVGAGPGDPELISVKGARLISEADCLIYDFLAAKTLLDNEKAEKIYVGKSGRAHTLEQKEINQLLVDKAKEGKKVVRLKGGDPFIFGRGGEEALELVKNGIDFEIVPGISSAYGAPAYAGIPVTQRGMTSTVAFITGHEDPTKDKSDIDWSKISTGIGTLVFLMGVKNLPLIAENLIKNGRDPKTDVALVRWGTTTKQETLTGKLDDIAEKVKKAGFKSPAIIVVGEVVSLRDSLKWFDDKPLSNKTFIVTRTRDQASVLTKKLKSYGANVIEVPTIEIKDPEDKYQSVDDSIEKLGQGKYDWMIFTSPNGVKRFFIRVEKNGYDSRIFADTKICVIGPATEMELKKHGLSADLMPDDYKAEGIVEKLIEKKPKNVLIARAKEARDVLPDELGKISKVDIAVTYQTVMPGESKELLEKTLKDEKVDMVTFTSSSTALNYSKMVMDRSQLKGIKFASIGPITTETARNLGFEVAVEAEKFTIDGLVEAILEYYSK